MLDFTVYSTWNITVFLSFLKRERERERTVNVPWTSFCNRFRPFILDSMIVAYRLPSLTVTNIVPDRFHDCYWPFMAVQRPWPFNKRQEGKNGQGQADLFRKS